MATNANKKVQNKRTWLAMTIEEPFKDTWTGVRCAAGSKWYFLPKECSHVEFMAAYQRKQGYTVTVAEEVR